ncbi:MAG: BREX system P-loop protein BrxC, partial [Clostridiaceae bacterium]|nr:BREX system P-loop protein BrxC [Clostridiaceae bacterium]
VQDREIVKYLTKRDYADRLLIEKRIKVPAHQINNVRELCKELFNITAVPSDEDGLMRRVKDLTRDEISKINELLIYYKQSRYPGQNILKEGKETLEKICKIHDSKEFYDELQRDKDVLLDYADGSIDVKKFFDSNQKEFFDKAVHKIDVYNSNKTYVLDKEVIDLVGQMQKVVGSQKPYSDIHKLPSLIDRFVVRFTELLEVECKPVRQVIESDYEKVLEELNKYEFKPVLIDSFKGRFEDLLYRLDHANNFYEAIAMKEESDRLKLRCFDEIAVEISKIKPLTPPIPGKHGKQPEVNDPPGKYKKTVNISIANILHGAKSIESESDIEDVVNEIRNRLRNELKGDIIIKLV